MSLHKIALTQGVKRTDTRKLFWGIYSHCIKFRIPEHLQEERREGHHAFWKKVRGGIKWAAVQPSLRKINTAYRDQVNHLIQNILDKNADAIPAPSEYYYQTSDTNVTFYFKEAAPVEGLLIANPGVFHTYSAPVNDIVADRLKVVADRKVEIRKKPYYGEFPYRITFKWERNYEDLDARVLALSFEDSVYSLGATRVLYVKSEDDFFLAKIGLDDRIDKVSECLTISDIENNA
jgi:hypothetical protein